MADTATAQEHGHTAAIDRISYHDLYKRWENGNWKSTELDFSQDRKDWHETFSDLERRAALWNYSMFFHGEDSVTDNLSPYIDAAPKEIVKDRRRVPETRATTGLATAIRRTKSPIAAMIERNASQRAVTSRGVAAVSEIEGITNCGAGPAFGPTANVNAPRTGWPSTEITRQ